MILANWEEINSSEALETKLQPSIVSNKEYGTYEDTADWCSGVCENILGVSRSCVQTHCCKHEANRLHLLFADCDVYDDYLPEH